MKQILTFLMLTISYMLCGAQATSLTVNNKVAGTLSQRVLYDDKLTVENIAITGEINGDDLEFLQELNSIYSLHGVIDVSQVQLKGCYSTRSGISTKMDNSILVSAFRTQNRLKKLILPESATVWGESAVSSSSESIPQLNADSIIIARPNYDAIGGLGNPHYIYIGEGLKAIYINNHGAYDKKYDSELELFLPSSLKNIYVCSSEYGKRAQVGTPSSVTIHAEMIYPPSYGYEPDKDALSFFSNGVIYVPEGSKTFYENSMFKNLEIIAPVSVKNITLSQDKVQLKVGESTTLTAIVLPEDADNKSIIWKSSNTDIATIATVDSQGVVRALKEGVCEISVTACDESGTTASCMVIVGMDSAIDDITVDNQEGVMIYSVQGLLLFKGQYIARPYLSNGIYILKTESGKTVKLIIKN